ncbi:RNA dependent RNA polymerase [viral metagenome]
MASRVQHSTLPSRVAELGRAGQVLLNHISDGDLRAMLAPVGQQIVYVQALAEQGRCVKAAAVSILLSDVTVQVDVGQSEFMRMVRESYRTPCGHGAALCGTQKCNGPRCRVLEAERGARGDVFERKSHPGAVNKVNVYWSDALVDCKKYCTPVYSEAMSKSWLFEGLYEDSATACLMQAAGIAHVHDDSVWLVRQMMDGSKTSKGWSTIIKSLGLNGRAWGAMIVESSSLLGRAVGDANVEEEKRMRCDRKKSREMNATWYDPGKLREAVRTILTVELGSQTIEYPDIDEWWSRRWLWCVNGSHSRVRERVTGQHVVDVKGQIHRRVFMENVEDEPVSGWDGKAYYSASEKLENGKSRCIIALDSVSYSAFEYFLKPVEKAWRGVKVILDPGSAGHIGVRERLEKVSTGAAVNLMLDYDAFNEQHSLEAMAIVYDELAKYVNLDDTLRKKLVSSVYNGYIEVDGVMSLMLGSLCSGHRGTTFINSVLNLAYLMVADSEFFSSRSVHVGDDIYVACTSYEEAERILLRVRETDLRLNPMKQSLGHATKEFLRIATRGDCSYGYLARSVAACVEGNWVGERRLSKVESLQSMVQHAWTLRNRSVGGCAHLMLVSAICRYTGMSRTRVLQLVRGTVALGCGPSLRRDGRVVSYEVKEVVEVVNDARTRLWSKVKEAGGQKFATTSYMLEHITPEEVVALRLAQTDVSTVMLEASYSKSLAEVSDAFETGTLRVTEHSRYVASGSVLSSELIHAKVNVGVFEGMPIMNLVKGGLTVRQLAEVLRFAGYDPGPNPIVTAFGNYAVGRLIEGVLSYSDSVALCRKTDSDTIVCLRPMYV